MLRDDVKIPSRYSGSHPLSLERSYDPGFCIREQKTAGWLNRRAELVAGLKLALHERAIDHTCRFVVS